MTSDNRTGARDGIEVHFDEGTGHLSLACESDAFERIRQFVAGELREFSEIRMTKVATIELIDTAKHVRRRKSPRKYWVTAVAIAGFTLMASAAIVGIMQFGAWIIRMIAN